MAEQGPLHAVAVAAEERLRTGGPTEDAPLAKGGAPQSDAFEVNGEVASREEGAHRLPDHAGVVGTAAAGHGHPLGNPAGLNVSEPPVGQSLDLEVDVAEAAGSVERQFGTMDEHGWIVDVTAHGRERCVPLLQARRLPLDQADGPGEP